MGRLESVAPELVRLIRLTDFTELGKAVAPLCEEVAKRTGLLSLRPIQIGLLRLRSGVEASPTERAGLEVLAAQLDEVYLTLNENEACPRQSVHRAFTEARAASAVTYAIQARTVDDYAEAVYEALMAYGQPGEFVEVARRVLCTVKGSETHE